MSGFDNSVLFVTKNTEGLQARFYYASDLSEEFDLFNSDGSPEGVIAADKGSICSDTTNGALYVKTTDTVNTGWSIITTGSGTVSSVTGTANRISIGGTASVPIVDIAATYVGQTSITTLGTITTGVWNGTDVAVSDGGTGLSATTAYSVLCGGTTSTAPLQSVASVGTSGQVLTSNGAGMLPTFQTVTAGAGLLQTEFTLTSLQIKSLNATPITVIAAQGAGTMIRVLDVVARLNYGGTNVFTTSSSNQNIRLYYDSVARETATDVIYDRSRIIAAASEYEISNANNNTSVPIADVQNLGVIVTTAAAPEIGGNAANDNTLNVSVLYMVITL